MKTFQRDCRSDWNHWSHAERISAIILSTFMLIAPIAAHLL